MKFLLILVILFAIFLRTNSFFARYTYKDPLVPRDRFIEPTEKRVSCYRHKCLLSHKCIPTGWSALFVQKLWTQKRGHDWVGSRWTIMRRLHSERQTQMWHGNVWSEFLLHATKRSMAGWLFITQEACSEDKLDGAIYSTKWVTAPNSLETALHLNQICNLNIINKQE